METQNLPKLSIVIPTLKEEAWIEGTVLQFKQLKLPHEVIVSDGGSKDRTVEIARRIADQVTVQESLHPRAAEQRNDGGRVARGEFIVFVDSTVRIPDINNFFERALAKFDADPQLVAIACPQRILPESETWADWLFLGLQNVILWFQNVVLRRGAGTGKTMIVRREAFFKVNGFREHMAAGEDLDFFLRLSKIGKVLFAWDQLIRYPGRRERALGWPRLLWVWTINNIWIWLTDDSLDKEWTPIR